MVYFQGNKKQTTQSGQYRTWVSILFVPYLAFDILVM